MHSIIISIAKELEDQSEPTFMNSAKRYFKEEVHTHGVKVALVTKIAKRRFHEISHLDKSEIFSLCDDLWKSGYLEESFIACHWSYELRKKYQEDDIQTFDRWLENYVHNWASCDTLCNHTVGSYLEVYPHKLEDIMLWAYAENRWKRRASAVSLIIPARKGLFLPEVFEIAKILLKDTDDLVQKGYGDRKSVV